MDGPQDSQQHPALAPELGGFPSERRRYASRVAGLLAEAGDDGTPVLDALICQAADAADAMFAQLSILTDQQFAVGLHARDDTAGGCFTKVGSVVTPLEDSVCSWALRGHEVIDIPDASKDPRVSSIPAVTSGFLAAYLGVPVQSDGGHTLGVLCVGDAEARPWTGEQLAALLELAALVSTELDRMAGAELAANQ